jgi:hypothetical protein
MKPIPKVAIELFDGGWCYVHRPDRKHQIWVRVEPEEEMKGGLADYSAFRFKIVEMHIDSGQGKLDPSAIRNLPFSAIESLINEHGEEVWETLTPKVNFEKIRRSEIRHVTFKEVKRLKLSKPEDGKLSDEFLIQVANFYRQSVQIGRPPIVAISEEVKIPYGTADSWVRKARARGFLSRGDAGKVS